MTTYSFDLNGVLDNALDFVDNVVPANTHFTNSLRKIPSRTPSFKWMIDDNDAYNQNAQGEVEGLDESDSTGAAPDYSDNTVHSLSADVLNYAQRFSKFVTISKTAARTAVHGKVSETQYQLEKAVTAMKNQIEKAFLSEQAKQAAAASTAALTDGAFAQLPADVIISGGVTIANVKDLMDKLLEAGSEADTILCGKGAYDLLSAISVGYVDGVKIDGKPVPSFVDGNGSVFGVLPSRYLEDGAVFVYNSKDFSMVVFRDWKVSQLDVSGSYDRYLVECEVGLRHDGKFKAGYIQPAAAVTPPDTGAGGTSNPAPAPEAVTVTTKAGKTKAVK